MNQLFIKLDPCSKYLIKVGDMVLMGDNKNPKTVTWKSLEYDSDGQFWFEVDNCVTFSKLYSGSISLSYMPKNVYNEFNKLMTDLQNCNEERNFHQVDFSRPD